MSPIDNLCVCDCSAIPETQGLPSSLTSVTLDKRLARHLMPERRAVDLPLVA